MSFMTAFSGLFVLSLLMTEFMYINFAGGIIRPYHLALPVVLFLFLPGVSRLFTTSVARSILFVLLVSVLSAAASNYPGNAARSMVLLVLNMSIAFAVAASLISGRLTIAGFSELLRIATLVMCGFALLQFLAFRLAGVGIALSDDQLSQIQRGFAPAFFNEANGLAKFLLTPMFFFLPIVVRRGFTRKMLVLYGLIALAFLINFMRSATAAILVATVVAALWYAKTRAFSAFVKRFAVIGIVAAVALAVFMSSGLGLSDYNLYKFTTLFDLEALSTDGSWEFRAAAMQLAIEQTLSDPFRIWIGNGWGQVYAMIYGEVRQVGGADIVNFFAYNGLFGVVSLLILAFTSIRSGIRGARSTDFDGSIGEGVYFALVANFALGLVSGVNLLASFWVMVGVGMAMEKFRQRQQSRVRFMESTA